MDPDQEVVILCYSQEYDMVEHERVIGPFDNAGLAYDHQQGWPKSGEHGFCSNLHSTIPITRPIGK